MDRTSLVEGSAFRILGLDTAGEAATILERSNEIQAYLGIQQVPVYPSDFRVFARPEPSVETVIEAVQRLETPRTRLFEEATWFHLRDAVDPAAAAALSEGNSLQARWLWGTA